MSVSLCAFRLELATNSPSPKDFNYLAPQYLEKMASNTSSIPESLLDTGEKEIGKQLAQCRGKRELRDVVIETYENTDPLSTPCVKSKSKGARKRLSSKQSSFDDSLQPTPGTSKESSPSFAPPTTSDSGNAETIVYDSGERKTTKEQLSFFCGNPEVEVVRGLIHFYKENQMTPLEPGHPRSQMICMLAIPAWLSCRDLLNFVAPCHPGIQRIRIVKDNTPNQYMALVLFRTQEDADEFYRNLNGATYNSLESEQCHLVYVSRVETCGEYESRLGGGGLPMEGHTELPTCPVCLERMDESVDGILTILCNHSFHGECLSKWGDTTNRCPICRYMQSPEESGESFCSECNSCESLWMCLICANVGCGRYVAGHAYKHFLETQHCYAMQLGNNRVWDYVSDNFVHRLLQNKADGKLVQVEGRGDADPGQGPTKLGHQHEEKLEAVQLEFTYVLTSQLESQRTYFEGLVARIEQESRKEKEELKERVKQSLIEVEDLKFQVAKLTKEKNAADKRATQLSTKLAQTTALYNEEKELNSSLMANQASWQQRVTNLELQLKQMSNEKDKSVADLQEQLRDVMFFLEAQNTIKNSELEGGQIMLGPSSSASAQQESSESKGKRKQRGKKK